MPTKQSWLGRAMPLVWAQRWLFGGALFLSFVSLVLQVVMPKVLQDAIDFGVVTHRQPITHYLYVLMALAVAAAVVSYVSRRMLLQTAYNFEYDLRTTIFTH